MSPDPYTKPVQQPAYRTPAALVAILAWIMPGLGHWFLGERARALIFFVVLTVTFWGGVAVGGVRSTVHPRENGAWIAAQFCMGSQALAAMYLSKQEQIRSADTHKAPWPASNISVVYTGIAGLLNLLIIIDSLTRADARSDTAAAPVSSVRADKKPSRVGANP